MKKVVLLLLIPAVVLARQEAEHKSIHQLESELHRNDPPVSIEPSKSGPIAAKLETNTVLAKKVYGWHPYWSSANAYLSYDYSVLSHIAYFSYETDTATGGYLTIHDWAATPIVAYAHQRGVKVTLTVTNFNSAPNTKFLSDTVKQQKMISTLITLLQSRNGDGVNFDFEAVPASQRANLVSFMRRAATQIKQQLPNAEISMASPAVDWSNAWDLNQLGQICDYLVVMGYDYYYSGSSTAGPVAPISGESYNITFTINTYLAAGVPASKLLLGLPWYGYDWPVQSAARKAAATGSGTSRTYVVAEQMAATYGKTYDQTTKSTWLSYQSGSTWRQLWYDDTTSLNQKYDLVNSRGLAGIGIWALGYDGGRPEIWNGMRSAFVATDVSTTSGGEPSQYMLGQNYPNPFNPLTTIPFSNPQRARVRLSVYDALGREVATLVDGELEAGEHQVRFSGAELVSGVYFYRLQSGSFTTTRKLVLIK